jgi:hypothetical protein
MEKWRDGLSLTSSSSFPFIPLAFYVVVVV